MSASVVESSAVEFDAFVRSRTGGLLRAAYFLTGDQHLAEDLVQTALARTHRAWPTLHATAAADAYTRKTMYHLQVSWWRRRKVAETLTGELPVHASTGADVAESTTLQLTMRSVLLRLPPRQRAVLVLRFFDDLTEAQTAEALGVTVGTVKSQTAKALARIRVLAPELKDYYSGAADEVKPADLHDRALASSRKLAARRTAAVSSAVAALVLVLIVALTTIAGKRDQPTPVTPTPSPSPAPSVIVLPSPVSEPYPGPGPFHDTTITVPAWSGSHGGECPSGRVPLDRGGVHHNGVRQVWVGEVVETDMDGDGTKEIVTILHCGEGPEGPGAEVVAYRRGSAGKLILVGRVVGTRDGYAMLHHLEATAHGVVVELSEDYNDSGQNTVPYQRRTYRLVGGRFRQVAGPTSFPADPPFATLFLTATDLAFHPAAEGRFAGHMTVTVANTGRVDVARLRLTMIVQGWMRPAGPGPSGDGWAGCTAQSSEPPEVGIACPISGPRAGSAMTLQLDFTADALPPALTPETEFDFQPLYSAWITQLPPYSYEQWGDQETGFAIVRP